VLDEYISAVQSKYNATAFQQIIDKLKPEEQRAIIDSILDDNGYPDEYVKWAKEVKRRTDKKE
jgi:hypothetical protein